ncbi:Putative Flp pilus-assembly TadE/G [Spongiibacter sp. IMCC21906]|uniref:pilus assembly protein TadG-related protein n=1 Tax=Spongiibacter sp. IMCC21906 TaxID=1620392 RepID=UPI00062DEB25|nr:pilus assembly protein TadG-related protein [Spongiibacter sp. IMCC21906]AKH69582.1 Putative Flp pilus-assembly TadE/G [Spongiibacter sp. IMCC21906]
MITANKTTLRQRQQGVVAVMAAVMMITLIMFLAVVVDTGRIFLEKRSLQKNADLAALETALLYCRDQTMDDAGRRSVALDALSADRNDFKGNFGDEDEDGDIKVSLGRVQGGGAGGRVFTPNSAGENGKAVEVKLTRTIPASLFQQLWPSSPGDIDLYAEAVAQACEPTAQLAISGNIVSIDSTQSELLNAILGGLLGTTLNLNVADWQSLVDTDINLLNYMDALASELTLDAGSYDSVLSSEVSVSDLLNVAADVLPTGNTATLSALNLLSGAIPGATPLVKLGDILELQTGTDEAGLDSRLSVLDFVQSTIQLANSESGIVANLPTNLLGLANATIRLQVGEPPKLSAIGNPELVKLDPDGPNQIYVRSAQLRVFISLDLPALDNALDPLLDNALVSSVADTVNDLLALDLIGVLSNLLGSSEEQEISIRVLPSPRLDVVINAGHSEARVSDYSCAGEDKTLDVETNSQLLSASLGQLGNSTEEASTQAFSDTELEMSPFPILDIGEVLVRKTCLVVCYKEYWTGSSWSSNPANAQRTAFTGGGIGLRWAPSPDSGTVSGTPLDYENYPDETYLPDVDNGMGQNAFQTFSEEDLLASLTDTIGGIGVEFYEPNGDGNGITGSGLGLVTTLVGSTANTLVSTINSTINSALSPILDPVLNQVLQLLGANIAAAEVGGSMTCENDKVRLVM